MDAILVLNGGSSSLKFAVFEAVDALPVLLRGSVSSLQSGAHLRVEEGGEVVIDRVLGDGPTTIEEAFRAVGAVLAERAIGTGIARVGHRIVHGGRDFKTATRLGGSTRLALAKLEPWAPIHQTINLQLVELAANFLPHADQIGCFDTAFHAARPTIAKVYGLPRALTDDGIVSYGFHGLSYSSISAQLRARHGPRAGGRAIVAHLGSGASLCAMKDGLSVATTMGFSTLDGLVMSTRCGSLDPGVILHLLHEGRRSTEELVALLYDRSGLLGVSGISGDMQSLHESNHPFAREAIDLFVYRVGREIGSLAAALGGLDTLVFTAGIGENSPGIRSQIGKTAEWLGVAIDASRNERGDQRIDAVNSGIEVLVISTDEEREVARQVVETASVA